MKPEPKFLQKNKEFWACVRSLSQEIGYTDRRLDRIKIPTAHEMVAAFERLGLNTEALASKSSRSTNLGNDLHEYFSYRAHTLNSIVKPKLMDATQAKSLFDEYRKILNPTCPLPMNKQSGIMKDYAFLTGLVNMMIEKHAGQNACDYDPRKLTTITQHGIPQRTLARRVDGAFPSSINPVAIWEIKEYYYTTTFGSRVADGVYESLLDGLELEELHHAKNIKIRHYLMVDAYRTWWIQGKAYLCRIVDMLHMGYVDEVLFGREVVEELPRIVSEWRREISS